LQGYNMKNKPRLRSPSILAVVAWCFAASLSGCSTWSGNAPVNANKARETLRAALDSWKKGDKVDVLKHGSPAIYVIDMEWQDGGRLADYQLVNDGEEKDAHLFCPVKLTIRGPDGKEVERIVTYIVSTAPNLTVSRKVF
jgi:hypothetical protein